MNNKGADQPAHPRSLISTFVVRYLDSKIPVLAKSKISRLLISRSCADRFKSYLVGNPEDRFSRDEAHFKVFIKVLASCLQLHSWHASIDSD